MQKKQIVLLAFGGLSLFTLVFGIATILRGHRGPVDPRLEREQLGIARLQDVHYLFYTPGSHADLQAARPDLVAAADERAFAQAVQLPGVFRALDHQRQFDALLLAGDPTTYEPLLRHLEETGDFVLTWLDNSVLIFRRKGAPPWTESDLAAAAAQFQGENLSRFLAGAGRRLVAVDQIDLAKRALDEARPLGGNLPEFWTAQSLYDGKVSQWNDALDAVNRALALQSDFTPAMATKADILAGAKRFDEALAISDQIVAEHPDDASMLFLHATISHEARSYDRETAALQHLIDLARAQGQSATGYLLFLGQAYGEQGDGMRSLMEFKEALQSPDITPAERKSAQDCIDKIGQQIAPQQQPSP